MTDSKTNEIIIIRSLTNSDLGLFAAHRPTTSSKQRALNINSVIAERLLSPEALESHGLELDCDIIFENHTQSSKRFFGKIGKNWRLGGKKIIGSAFSKLDSRDFALIRSIEYNDGSHPVSILFISRTTESFLHARIVRLVEATIKDSMALYREGSAGFNELAVIFPSAEKTSLDQTAPKSNGNINFPVIPPMPKDNNRERSSRTIKDKVRSKHILEEMLKISGDLSAPAQISFLETVELLATQLRDVLLASKRIICLKKDHKKVWASVAGTSIGFVDGGLANLSMLGSAPIAARVGGYIVKPGNTTNEREKFVTLKRLISELYSSDDTGVYNGSFPDISALRDAARIAIEAAGAVHLLKIDSTIKYLFVHGALVNPVSRYTDIMRDGQPRYHFPKFSTIALNELLPGNSIEPQSRNTAFVNVYLKQLEALESSDTSICGVIEREATTTSVIRAILASLEDQIIAPYLPMPPAEWKKWFREIVDPLDEDDGLGQRITDSLLFRCVLEPGEALLPVKLDRNELRRAPENWKDIISKYPYPFVSYLQSSEWNTPIRLEVFEKDLKKFNEIADLIFHCSLLLPQYAFPAGLDIVDKFARIPNWMSRPINTNTAVQVLKSALYKGDENLFNSVRRMLCGSSREWLLRPGIMK